ncbi:MAG: DNA topoisomerase I [Desulfurococcales archaeon]|nr:DNA topoisomerase I [Desulfurococcales archaeon]
MVRKQTSHRTNSNSCKLKPGYTLVIAEKPKAASRIALALNAGKKCYYGRASYYIDQSRRIVIASAAGHLYGLYTKKSGYPVFTYEWIPIHEYERGTYYLKPYYNLLSRLTRDAGLYVNACDYDIEGSVIGYMVIAKMGDPNRAKRMKYSTLTQAELRVAWRKLVPLDTDMVEAGIARHEVDWLWGINISRALMDLAKRTTGRRIILSAGRVQSPTLVKAYQDWMERRLYVPDPVFEVIVFLEKDGVKFNAKLIGDPETRKEALMIAEQIGRDGKLQVLYVERKPYERKPPPPFNLPDLQAEASRIYGYSPSETQKLAEDLYLAATISYPRTNSQKLPATIGYRNIIGKLGSIYKYKDFTKSLLSRDKLYPRQGPKEDPAHPAIYPTGYISGDLTPRHYRIHDLIVRRFLATFSDNALLVRTDSTLTDIHGRYKFQATGTSVVRPGWMEIYIFSRPEEKPIPPLSVGELVDVMDVKMKTVWPKPTDPPIRKINLVKWMEKVGIGTEATRARIVDTLYRRGYLKRGGMEDEVTNLGVGVARLVMNAFPQLSTPDLTRKLEEDLESIRIERNTRSKVVLETRRIITKLLDSYEDLLESEKANIVAEEAGLRIPKMKCRLCNMPAKTEVNGVPLCDVHYEAYIKLKRRLPSLKYRVESPVDRLLSKIIRVSGRFVADVAKEALRDKKLYTELSA